jgi:hypothetical protein
MLAQLHRESFPGSGLSFRSIAVSSRHQHPIGLVRGIQRAPGKKKNGVAQGAEQP